jgi:hypothetical protein
MWNEQGITPNMVVSCKEQIALSCIQGIITCIDTPEMCQIKGSSFSHFSPLFDNITLKDYPWFICWKLVEALQVAS